MKEENTITVRSQKIQSDRTKARLYFFLFLTALLLLIVIFAEQICPYDPNAQDTGAALLPPGSGHIAGTDRFGRDMLSRILVGLKTSVTSALILVSVITVTGSILGLICGYFGGIADTVIMRISDICLAFPGLVFAMAMAQICQNCKKPDPDGKKYKLYGGQSACGVYLCADDPAPYPAEYCRTDSGNIDA